MGWLIALIVIPLGVLFVQAFRRRRRKRRAISAYAGAVVEQERRLETLYAAEAEPPEKREEAMGRAFADVEEGADLVGLARNRFDKIMGSLGN